MSAQANFHLARGTTAVASPFCLSEHFLWRPGKDPVSDVFIVGSDLADSLVRNRFDLIPRETIRELLDAGVLVDTQQRDRLADAKSDSTSTYALVVMTTGRCPLGCNKSEFGNYCGQTHSPRKLPKNSFREFIDHHVLQVRASEYSRVSARFFGGEPMLNNRLIIETLALLHQKLPNKEILGSIVSSGYVGSRAVFSSVIDAGVASFEITLDGPGFVHNARRPLKDGRPTFDRIIANISTLLDIGGAAVTLRCNVDDRNCEYVEELVEYLSERRILPACGFYIAPIRNWGDKNGGDVYRERTRYASTEIRIFRKLYSIGLNPDVLPRLVDRTCIAVTVGARVLGPDGHVYRCTEVPLSEKWNGNGWNDVILEDWWNALQDGETPCLQCRFFDVCRGGCPKEWLKNKSPCPSFQENINERILLFGTRHHDILPRISYKHPASTH